MLIHIAAQAGVRYSIENPRSNLESNIVETFELLEAVCAFRLHTHCLRPHLRRLWPTRRSIVPRPTTPISIFRFVTVYGPKGCPDMAPFKFTEAILEDGPIDVYRYSDMKSDCSYVVNLVHAIRMLIYDPPVA